MLSAGAAEPLILNVPEETGLPSRQALRAGGQTEKEIEENKKRRRSDQAF
jgi:hypothetical protein